MEGTHIDRNAWHWVTQPTLLLHTATARRNLTSMVSKMRAKGLDLRPHFKTHQSAELGEWFRAEGIDKITVSSLEMARYFADAGWQDILVAFPANLRAMSEINALAGRVRLSLLVSAPAVAQALTQGLQAPVRAWVEVDTGDTRSGIRWDQAEAIAEAVDAIDRSEMLEYAGLVGHAGYTYRSMGATEVEKAHGQDVQRLLAAAAALKASRGSCGLLSTGDTPSCSLSDFYPEVDEVRPGNFVFYDIQQQQIGSCGFEQIAVALAAPVVGVYPERSEVVVHAGGVHLGKDFITYPDTGACYGQIALPTQNGWTAPIEGCYLRSISQEHGVARLSPALLREIRVGDILAVLPVHSCMTADLMTRLYPIDGMDPQSPILMMKAAHAQAGKA